MIGRMDSATTTAAYNSNNTDSSKRGKYGAKTTSGGPTYWAPDTKVYVWSNSHWDSETISIHIATNPTF